MIALTIPHTDLGGDYIYRAWTDFEGPALLETSASDLHVSLPASLSLTFAFSYDSGSPIWGSGVQPIYE